MITKNFIKQCEQAEEIQKKWGCNKGDWIKYQNKIIILKEGYLNLEILEKDYGLYTKRIEQDDADQYQWMIKKGSWFEVEKTRNHEIFDMKQNGEYEEYFDRKIKKLEIILMRVSNPIVRDLIILKMLDIKEAPVERDQCLQQVKELRNQLKEEN